MMTDSDKLGKLKLEILPDSASDELLLALLSDAESIVLNKQYPFGYSSTQTVEPRYESIQIAIAKELFSKMGIEGQTEHSENGIIRTFEAADVSPSLLKKIVSNVGSVVINA